MPWCPTDPHVDPSCNPRRAVSAKFAEKLQKLRGADLPEGSLGELGALLRIPRDPVLFSCWERRENSNAEALPWQLGHGPKEGRVVVRNHRSYADKWGYEYEMLFQRPVADEEPQFGKLQVALEVLSQHPPPEWFLWLDCDTLVTNRSISIQDLLVTYDIGEDETSGINSGVFLLRGGDPGLRFLKDAMTSNWRFVWDQTMLLHQMAMDSDLLGQDMCRKWRKGEDISRDFQWAPHLRLVPQHVQHSDCALPMFA
eukprot:Skav216684  [mRNA]  locus=scaffold91:133277:135477:+ [translate_table: standard]